MQYVYKDFSENVKHMTFSSSQQSLLKNHFSSHFKQNHLRSFSLQVKALLLWSVSITLTYETKPYIFQKQFNIKITS